MMTATLNDQSGRKKRPEPSAEAKTAAELVVRLEAVDLGTVVCDNGVILVRSHVDAPIWMLGR
ncbi:hypothetical protein AB0K35_04490 [Micromonospora sp. NPDC053740]|uniref:hypothetical protein n=1 Tax=Micromonospora sp. NPDC053740 TaxID=3155173 RepID=UPI0034161EE0